MTPQTHPSSLWLTVASTLALPPLQPNELQIWWIDLAASASLFDPCLSLLTAAERDRTNRRRQPQARQHSVVGRGCLRILLGAALQLDPRLVPITAGPNSKPQLPSPDIHFNVAHSGNTILIALCRNASVGIDVEQIDPHTDFLTIAQDSCTPTELATLATLTDLNAQRRAFYQCWTRKEAITKADGRGLLLPLASFDVATSPIRIPQSPRTFYLNDISIADDTAAAVAIDTPALSTKLLRFPPAISPG